VDGLLFETMAEDKLVQPTILTIFQQRSPRFQSKSRKIPR